MRSIRALTLQPSSMLFHRFPDLNPKILQSKKKFDPKFCFNPNNFFIKEYLFDKKKKFWPKHFFYPKHFFWPKNFDPMNFKLKIFWQKKFSTNKNLYTIQNERTKIFWQKKLFRPKNSCTQTIYSSYVTVSLCWLGLISLVMVMHKN